MTHHSFDTPLGCIRIDVDTQGALTAVAFVDGPPDPGEPPSDALRLAHTTIDRYLSGQGRIDPDALALEPAGTEFQRKVWACVAAIPVGETRSYLEIATRLGDPRRARAVGAANGANPLPIVIPCHRVVTATGALGGYLGGTRRKRWLLDLDRRLTSKPTQSTLFGDPPQ